MKKRRRRIKKKEMNWFTQLWQRTREWKTIWVASFKFLPLSDIPPTSTLWRVIKTRAEGEQGNQRRKMPEINDQRLSERHRASTPGHTSQSACWVAWLYWLFLGRTQAETGWGHAWCLHWVQRWQSTIHDGLVFQSDELHFSYDQWCWTFSIPVGH
jgi:hypothetical protein